MRKRERERLILYALVLGGVYLALRGQGISSPAPTVTWSPEGLPIETEQGPMVPGGATRRDILAL